jgi:hypothetical protein
MFELPRYRLLSSQIIMIFTSVGRKNRRQIVKEIEEIALRINLLSLLLTKNIRKKNLQEKT